MKAQLLSSPHSLSISPPSLHRSIFNPSFFNPPTFPSKPLRLSPLSSSNHPQNQWILHTTNPPPPPSPPTSMPTFTLGDRISFLLTFTACSTSVAFTGLVIAAVPTLLAMGRTATSLAKLADTTREELPSTMAAVRLSSMEINDLMLELSDLSEGISEGISNSTQAVQAAEAGIKQIGAAAHQQTMSLIQERADLPVISLQPVLSGVAKKTSQAVGNATKIIKSIFSREESSSVSFDDDDDDDDDDDGKDG